MTDRFSQQRHRRLDDALSIGRWDWHVEADTVTADAGFAILYGVDPALAREGAPIDHFFRGIHAGDLPRVEAAIRRSLDQGEPFDEEYRVYGPDGIPRWLAAQGRVERERGETHFPGVSFDIHARKTAELRLAALVELGDELSSGGDMAHAAHAASAIIGRTLDVTRVGYGTINPVAETIVSEDEWDAPGTARFPPILHFRDHGSFIDDLKRGDTVVIDDLALDPRTAADVAPSHALGVFGLINRPIVEEGRFVALLYVNSDRPRHWTPEEVEFVGSVAERTRQAVERRRAETRLAILNASLESEVESRTEALMRVEEQLRQAQKMEAVGQLTGGLAHDFNNLLTGISGALEMIQVRVSQGRIGDLDRYVNAAQGATRRAAALTHRLLAFSRRQTLDPRPTDANRLIAGIEELIRRTVGPEIMLEVVGAAGVWATLVDSNQLENALLNLCINARDAMPDGGRITIETANKWLDERTGRERDLPPGQYVSVCVTDTGTGMSPEVQARAFDPFYTTKPLGAGTGLGLSMIYGFIRQSGGQVRIYSELDQGTTVCLYLPRHYGEAEADETSALLSDPVVTGAEGQRTVLLVDDDPTIRMLAMEVLGEQGYTMLEAADGGAALRILGAGARPDLLVTDVGLPGQMNGRQVADAVVERLPKTKVLFITGYAENAVIGSGQLAPNMALLTKPFAMESLVAKVAGLLAD